MRKIRFNKKKKHLPPNYKLLSFKTIKNLQQRLNDMKKTLQKELKFQSLPNEIEIVSSQKKKEPITHQKIIIEESKIKTNEEFAIIQTMSPPTPTTPKNNGKPKPLTNDNEINFKYLKHVVLKFITSREYEVSVCLGMFV